MDYTTFCISLPNDQLEFIKQQAARRGVTFSDVVRAAVNDMQAAQQPAGSDVASVEQVFMVSNVRYKSGIVTLVTLNADDVSKQICAGQTFQLVASDAARQREGE